VSKQSFSIYELLIESFKYCTVLKEYYINYKGQQLFFDFYLKEYNLLFEIQGRQHSEYIEHFHGDKQGFISSKKRDNLKVQYCEENNFTLITINYDEKIETEQDLIEKINNTYWKEQQR